MVYFIQKLNKKNPLCEGGGGRTGKNLEFWLSFFFKNNDFFSSTNLANSGKFKEKYSSYSNFRRGVGGGPIKVEKIPTFFNPSLI